MKYIITISLFVGLLFVGCAKHGSDTTTVDVTFNLSAQQGEQADLAGRSFDPVAPQGYKLRYVIDVWYNGQRYVRKADCTPQITLALVPERRYDFLIWADYIPVASVNEDCHYNTMNGLKQVAVKEAFYSGSDAGRDAFCTKLMNIEVTSSFSMSPTLTRPFARIEIFNNELLGGNIPVAISYTTPLNNTYNVATGEASRSAGTLLAPCYPDAGGAGQTLMFDLLFVSQGVDQQCAMDISAGMTQKNAITVPIQTNKVTKISGTFK